MASKPRKILTKIVVGVLFSLLIASFVVWGIGDIFRAPSRVTTLAEVGDVEIGEREFRQSLSREINRLSARLGRRLDIQQAEALGIVDQVFGQLIGRALFDQKAEDLGMIVTKEQIARRIGNEPAFQNTLGEFSPGRFAQALQISNLGEQEYVDNLTRDIIRQQLVASVTGAVAVPSQLADKLFRYQQERRVAQVITVPHGSITDLGTPDETALAEIHKREAARFMAPEFRRLKFARLRAEDLLSEVAVPETELREEYDSRREDFDIQDRRTIEQVVLSDEAAARQVVDKMKDGSTFATAAEAATGQPPVALGEVEKADLPPELADAAFATAAGAITDPVQSPLGWHVINVVSVTPGREQSFEDVRDELAQDVGMRRAVDSMISIANQLDDSLGGGATLEEAASSLGLEIGQIDAVNREGNRPDGQPAVNLPSEPFLEVAFDTAAGTDSLLTESNDGGYFVLRMESVDQARLRPLAEVREQVVAQWLDQQRAERAEAKAQELAESLRGGAEFAAVAAKAGLITTVTEPLTRFDSRAPSNPAASLPGKLFQLRPGEVTTAQAPEGHIVAKLDKIIPADPTRNPEDLADVQDGVATALRNDLLEQFAAALRARYGVTINDRMVENTLANF